MTPSTQPISGRGSQSGVAVIGLDHWISAMSDEQLHQLEIAGLRRTNKRRGAGFKEPLHGKDRPRERVVFRGDIRLGSVLEEEFDVLQMIHIRLRNGDNRRLQYCDCRLRDTEASSCLCWPC